MIPDRAKAFSYTYRLRASETGFVATCRELNLGSEGDTVQHAIDALRAEIAAKSVSA